MKDLIVIFLILIFISLLGIEDAIEQGNLSPEEKVQILAREEAEEKSARLIEADREAQMQALRETPWGEVESEHLMMKAVAHGIHLWVFTIAFIAAGPILMRRWQDRHY